MLEWLKTNAAKARETLTTEVAKFKNRTFMEAIANGCALMSAADGEIKSEEDEDDRLHQQLRGVEGVQPDRRDQGVQRRLRKFEFDFQIGQAEALKAISKVKGKDGEARLLVRVVCAIGASDGDFDTRKSGLPPDLPGAGPEPG
jgi:tellurite resistance protein TerB